MFLVFEWVESGCAQNRTALVVDIAGIVWGEVDDSARLSHGEVTETVYETFDRISSIVSLNDAGADYGVDSWSRTTAHNDTEAFTRI